MYFLQVGILKICSDDVHMAYIDGELVSSGTRNIVNSVPVAHNVKVVAISVKNIEGNGGFRAAFTDNSLTTDESWKCLPTFHEGWQSVDFDDSSWPVPATTGKSSVCNGFLSSAKWLWTNSKYDQLITAYCRKTISKTIE